ncbi:glycerol-3-phosphate dehydrogenase [PVC group bacterium (ex Bugula neritina AB1)]|nr:glycerol-3-phosphate dehydrogenase [PVC group bacterium (ex Bugula neritina AB1)]
MKKSITVWGGGSWGTTLAILLANKNHKVSLWTHCPKEASQIASERENKLFLPGHPLPSSITVTSDISEALGQTNIHLLVIPSHVLRSFLQKLSPYLPASPLLWVSAIKGIEQESLCRMSEIILEETGSHQKVTCLSGPTHAEEVAKGIPSAAVIASSDISLSEEVQSLFNTDTFRLYTSTDIIGVELGGALKNTIAIAAGIADGLNLGANSKAALMTRGLSDIKNIGQALGASTETFSGLSGMGDLITTCTSEHSRNLYVGRKLGKGMNLKEIIDSMHMVAEGVKTSHSAHSLIKKHKIEAPIIQEIYNILFENKPSKQALADLLHRPQKQEFLL